MCVCVRVCVGNPFVYITMLGLYYNVDKSTIIKYEVVKNYRPEDFCLAKHILDTACICP